MTQRELFASLITAFCILGEITAQSPPLQLGQR